MDGFRQILPWRREFYAQNQIYNSVPTSPRSSTPVTDLKHHILVPNSKDGPHKVGPRFTYQGVGQSSDIGTIDLDVGDRHQTLPQEGEIGRRRSKQLYWAT